jgi:hypothetical protein
MGRQKQKQHKQRDLQFASTITYTLWEGKGRNSISKWICSLQAQSLTICGKAKAETAYAKGSAVCKHNYLHTVGRQRQKQHKKRDLRFASTITYFLWEHQGRNSVSIGAYLCMVRYIQTINEQNEPNYQTCSHFSNIMTYTPSADA